MQTRFSFVTMTSMSQYSSIIYPRCAHTCRNSYGNNNNNNTRIDMIAMIPTTKATRKNRHHYIKLNHGKLEIVYDMPSIIMPLSIFSPFASTTTNRNSPM